MRVLVTRPIEFSTGLCEKIRAMGDEPLLMPTINIQPILPPPLAVASRIIETTQIIVCVSQAAVRYGLPLLQSITQDQAINWLAIGPGTANALQQQSLKKVWIPKPPYETESLLQLPILSNIRSQNIGIVRGKGGRELLKNSLLQRGATVHELIVYERTIPQNNTIPLSLNKVRDRNDLDDPNNLNDLNTLNALNGLNNLNGLIDVTIVTSAESLHNLIQIVGKAGSHLKALPIVVVGPRMLALARQLEFNHILVATGADDSAIIKVLMALKDKME